MFIFFWVFIVLGFCFPGLRDANVNFPWVKLRKVQI